MTVAQFAQASLWEVFGHLVLGIILSGRVFIDAMENRRSEFVLPIPKTLTRKVGINPSKLSPSPCCWVWRDHGWRQDESPSLPVFKEKVSKCRSLLGPQRKGWAMPCGAIYA